MREVPKGNELDDVKRKKTYGFDGLAAILQNECCVCARKRLVFTLYTHDKEREGTSRAGKVSRRKTVRNQKQPHSPANNPYPNRSLPRVDSGLTEILR